MSFISMEFLLFLAGAILGYYLIPKRFQWVWLLMFSCVFYLCAGLQAVCFLLTTAMTTFAAGLWIKQREDAVKKRLALLPAGAPKEDKKALKERCRRQKCLIVAGTLLVNFGILGALKYMNFAIDNLNALLGLDLSRVSLLLPLGISFYTFQSMGYLIDVYRGKYEPERNPFRFALFVSFFPQLLQGPIGRFDRLSTQLYEEHRFDLTSLQRGLLLMVWGYFKKIVIADRDAVLVNQVFGNYEAYTGFAVIAAVLGYSVQLYCDFSGGMDVVMGASECFGIHLDQNFKRPYFARSISDFWHRWHITLGTWMKDYLFYPLSLSKAMNRFGKFTKKHFGRHVGRVLPVCISNLVIFFVVGVWHGAAWKFIVYGLYNGIIIALSNLLAPLYTKLLQALHIPVKSRAWTVFQILRTFVLVNISWYFDMGSSLSAAFAMMRNTFRGLSPAALTDGSLLSLGLGKADFLVLGAGCAVLFTVSLLQERNVKIRESLAKKPLIVRLSLYLLLLFSIPLLGQITITGGGFIYAQF